MTLPPAGPGVAPVRVSVTPFGRTGPYRDWKATDFLIYALSGGMIGTGVAEREPLKTVDGLMEYQAGLTAAVACLGAVLNWRRYGEPQAIDLATYEVAAASADRRLTLTLGYAYTGWSSTREQGIASVLPNGMFPCKDGLACVVVSPNTRWPRFVAMLGHPELVDDPELNAPDAWSSPSVRDRLDLLFYTWLADRTKHEVMATAQAHRVAGTAMNTPLDLLDDPHLAARRFWQWADHPRAGRVPHMRPAFRVEVPGIAGTGDSATGAARAPQVAASRDDLSRRSRAPSEAGSPGAPAGPARQLPLAGLRVLDITVIWAGPMATQILADLGAEVIRIESLQHFPINTRGIEMRPARARIAQLGALGRAYADRDPGERPWNRHALFNSLGRNKLSMTVNLRAPEGVALVRRLARLSDVLVENAAPGTLGKLGLGPETLIAENPSLIYLSMPVFGSGGPYAEYQGFGLNAEALSGLAALRGYRDGDETMIGRTNHMDTASGAGAALAVLVALAARARTGRGRYVEFSQLENLLFQLGGPIMDAAMNRRVPPLLGNRDPVRVPQGVYPCEGEDRWIAISVGKLEEWAALCRLMGRLDLAESDSYADDARRQRHHDALDAEIAAWTRDKDARWVMNTLQMHGVPAAMVARDADVFVDPHLRARGFFHTLTHPEAGTHDYPGYPWVWPGVERPTNPPPCLGEHNAHIYKELLGFSAEAYAHWEAAGHIGRDYRIGKNA
jgi:benzylsuccinate CoA-transferase BbsF subunit/naphthyl-2-methylsuccinate CoA transferase subunit